MNEARRRRLAKTAMAALILNVMACDEPAKSAADQNGDGGVSRGDGIDRAGATEKSHCAGDEKH
jgi:hypothetical protein